MQIYKKKLKLTNFKRRILSNLLILQILTKIIFFFKISGVYLLWLKRFKHNKKNIFKISLFQFWNIFIYRNNQLK